MVDLVREARVARALLFEPLDAAMNDDDLGSHIAKLIVDGGELCVDVLKFAGRAHTEVGDLPCHARDVVFDA
jgi:hypothetical protein